MSVQVSSLPASPAELLRHLQSDGYKQAQRDQAQRVQGSFEVRDITSSWTRASFRSENLTSSLCSTYATQVNSDCNAVEIPQELQCVS